MGCAAWRSDWASCSTRFLPRPDGRPREQGPGRTRQGQDKQKQAATAPELLPNGGPGLQPGPASRVPLRASKGDGGDRLVGWLWAAARPLPDGAAFSQVLPMPLPMNLRSVSITQQL